METRTAAELRAVSASNRDRPVRAWLAARLRVGRDEPFAPSSRRHPGPEGAGGRARRAPPCRRRAAGRAASSASTSSSSSPGFLITGILLAQARAGRPDLLVDFYMRRARRILPAAALTLVVTEVAACLLLNFVRARDAVWDVLFAAAFAANFRFAEQGSDYFAEGGSAFAGPPLLVARGRGAVLPRLAGAALDRPLRNGVQPSSTPAADSGTTAACSSRRRARRRVARLVDPPDHARSAGRLLLAVHSCVGAGAGCRARRRRRRRCAHSARGGSAWGGSGLPPSSPRPSRFDDATPFPGSWALVPTVGTALMICAGMGERRRDSASAACSSSRRSASSATARTRSICGTGRCSSSPPQYAGHELPVRTNLVLLLGRLLPVDRLVRAVRESDPASYVEREAERCRARVNGDGRCRRRGGLARCARGEGGAVRLDGVRARGRRGVPGEQRLRPHADARRPHRGARRAPAGRRRRPAARRGDPIPAGLMPPIGRLRNEAQPFFPPPGCVPVAASSQSTSKICPVGRTSSSKTLVVIGDSHAQMWMPAILRLAERDGWRVLPLLRPGCTPDTWVDARGLAACRPWYRWATAQVGRLRPRVTSWSAAP